MEDRRLYDIAEYHDADSDVQRVYDDIMEHLGQEGLVDYFKMLGQHNTHALTTTWALLKSTLLQGVLPRSLKELVFVAISNEKDCAYCTKIHTALCKMLDINESTLQAVLNKSPNLNPQKLKLAIDFAVKAAIDSNEMSELDHQTLIDAGISKQEIFELMCLASVVNYSNSLSQSMMVGVDENIQSYLNR